MEVPQGFAIEEEKQGTANSIANHTALLESTKWSFAILEEHTHALRNLTHQQEKINAHFTLSECQVD